MKTNTKQIEELKEKNLILREKAKEFEKKFKDNLKNSLKTAIVTAFGLLIALQWQSLITKLVNGITGLSPIQGIFITTLIITVVCVLGILITTRLLSNQEEISKS